MEAAPEAAAVEMTTKSDSSLSDMQNAFTVFCAVRPLVLTALMRQSEERSQLCELFDVSPPSLTAYRVVSIIWKR